MVPNVLVYTDGTSVKTHDGGVAVSQRQSMDEGIHAYPALQFRSLMPNAMYGR